MFDYSITGKFDDAMLRLGVLHKISWGFTSDARDYLYSIASGHPGAVSSLMSYRSELGNESIPQITKQRMVDLLLDEQTVFEGLEYKPFAYFFPRMWKITASAMEFLW
ncbi:uncharacterized protein EURHEDRAFT_414064 [Aspergillus ruber CBS 135680]|uniref:Uncharacterized protein n=1 Tax=Aspergillus ruber (strain CBS 135680) TaxID=1388766 RepID=A0A017SA29_ASPRC|nr:uncharacterized protein EURHEDRAFT_414064 [Aspergillus ruber CBS 135680]EYE93651.1 hypothetical protein EURHEDRAFT_414064 [Aspergillus ruber CBS 135680]